MDVKALCLGVLAKGPATGYEIKKLIQDGPYQHFIEASFGSIYPSLSRLAAEGLIEARTEPLEGRPDKKIYSLTPQGREAFRSILSRDPPEDKFRSGFLFQMMFADALGPEEKTAKIEGKLAEYRARHARMVEKRTSQPLSEGELFCLGFGESLVTAAIAYLDSHARRSAAPAPSPAPARRVRAGTAR
ncbi:MAG: PadR family transcriptional regulator [Alphaproteobacteria bacterium]|nr:PadR family transcriptional regulator [Alphaproteobacteria bacterium]